MKFLKYALIVLFSAGMMSCGGGGGGDKADEQAPTVNITSPTVSTKVTSGQDITVSFTATDNVELNTFTLTIEKAGSTKSVGSYSYTSVGGTDAEGNNLPTINGKTNAPVSFKISTKVGENKVAEAASYKLTLTVNDVAGNSTKKDVTFEIE
jgi:hypothetical protein